DPRYATHTARGEHQEEMDIFIAEWTKTMTSAELLELMDNSGVPAGKIFKAPDMLEDPHFAARDAVIDVAHDMFPNLKMQNTFPKLSETPGKVEWAGPTLGQHNEQVYGEILGMSTSEMASLEAEGII
ncbi:MAG: CoA transferase, partial [Pseudomonadota bacterium]